MKKKNQYLDFISNIESYCNRYFSELYMTDKLLNLMPIQHYCDARETILTGCGPCYSAAMAVHQFMNEKTDIFFGCRIVDSNDLAYFSQYSVTGIGEPNTPLVIIIDFTGDCPETLKILENGKHSQTNYLLICAKTGTPAEQLATHTLNLNIPADAELFDAHAYLASVIALICLTIRTGRIRGTLTAGDCEKLERALPSYFSSLGQYSKTLILPESLLNHAANAVNWDCIADHTAFAPANFISYLATKKLGSMCTISDSEEWTHANFYLTNFNNIFTLCYAPKNSKSIQCICETIGSVSALRNFCVVITDSNSLDIPSNVVTLQVPVPPEDCDYLFAIAAIIPNLMLIGQLLDSI